MKSLSVIFALFILTSGSGFPPTTPAPAYYRTAPMGSIVMEDAIMMLVDTGNPSVTIATVKVYDSSETLVLTASHCYSDTCRITLSSLPSGDYDVFVETNNSPNDFGGEVTLN